MDPRNKGSQVEPAKKSQPVPDGPRDRQEQRQQRKAIQGVVMSASQLPFVGNFNFLVEIEGITPDSTSVIGGFSEVSGLSSQSDVIEYRVGNSRSVFRIPGRSRAGNIVLRKGVTSGDEIARWRSAIEKGLRDVRSGSIILLDADMSEKTRWNFYEAWPCRYEGPVLDAAGEQVAVETLELCVERIERVDPSQKRV